MAERKQSTKTTKSRGEATEGSSDAVRGGPASGESSTTEDSPRGAASTAKAVARPRAAVKPKRRKINVGGHITYVDVPPEAKVTGQCSIHGVELVDGRCPEPHEGRGWAVEK